MSFALTANQNAQVETPVVNYHLVNGDVVLYQKQFAVLMESIAVQMDTLAGMVRFAYIYLGIFCSVVRDIEKRKSKFCMRSKTKTVCMLSSQIKTRHFE